MKGALFLVVFVWLFSCINTQYDHSIAYTMALYSSASYCPPQLISNWTCNQCLMEFTFIDKFFNNTDDGLGFIGYDSRLKAIVVVFRGTEPTDLKNWITDLQFFTLVPWKNYPLARVHSGFYGAYQALRTQVLSSLFNTIQLHPGTPIYVTGHSLGAALSLLATLDIQQELNNSVPITLYNFGSPRVGNKAFAQLFNQTVVGQNVTYRVVHAADLVPHLPLENMGMWQNAREIWYPSNNMTYMICDDSGEDPKCSDSVLFPDSVMDHIYYFGIGMGFGCS